ncbi:MAG TPA: DEAD/DEAH box helicase [Acidimicrobiales bacterium]|nr:DEAD/DEAH box helicase [Acidimicrobiales bacterium]
MTTFAALGLRDALVDALGSEGITEPFPIQEQTISDALAGRDVCGKARTGSGKTLAFGLPLLERIDPGATPRHPTGLVLAPTRELVRQIVDVLAPLAKAVGVQVAGIYGGAPMEAQIDALKKGLDLAIATPGRLIDLLDRGAIVLDDIRHVVIDEADHMADLGFLPQVQWIMRRVTAAQPQVMLFSATLDGEIDVLVRDHLKDPVKHEVVDDEPEEGEELQANLVHRFFQVHQMDRARVAAAIAKGQGRTIAFVRTKRFADRFTDDLVDAGVRASAIHGDLRQQMRERALKQFSDGKLDILVATDVAARGIHVNDVAAVIHVDPPEDRKAYIHRSGRTARAGAQGVVATFVLWDQVADVEKLKRQLAIEDEPTIEVFSNDPRLADLRNFEVAEGEVKAPEPVATPKPSANRAALARSFGGRRGGRGRR